MSDRGDADPGLLERARLGDREAFAALVLVHDAGLRALAYRLLGDRERMDDVLQETYLRAFRALPRFRGAAALGTWLYRIAYNACLDELARVRAAPSLTLEQEHERLDGRPDPADTVSGRAELAEALARLAPIDRAAVLLVDAQGFDYASAAEVLGVPVGTVASRLSRARRALRRALGERAQGVAG